MTTEKGRLPHEDRTATEPRSRELHPVILEKVETVNDVIRLFKLKVKDEKKGVKFLPGQWLDVHIPNLSKAGGFTITSTPRDAAPPTPFLELAVQRSPENPPAAWLWQDPAEIVGKEMAVRVGGSFVYPPAGIDPRTIEKVVFVAGGVGINPLISMLSHMHATNTLPAKVEFLYSAKPGSKHPDPGKILFLSRLNSIAEQNPGTVELTFFLTGGGFKRMENPTEFPWHHTRRIEKGDFLHALGTGNEARANTVCYVCGPPEMTDELVGFLGEQVGKERVFCEKWW